MSKVSSALQTAGSKNKNASDRIDALVVAVGSLNTRLGVLSSAQITALAGLSTSQINALATISASQLTTLGTTNIGFLASLSQMGGAAWYPMTSNTASADGAAAWQVLNALLNQLQSNGYHA